VRRYALLPDRLSPEAQRVFADERERLVDELCAPLDPLRAGALRLAVRLSLRAIQLREAGRLQQSLLFGEARGAVLRFGELLAEAGALRSRDEVFDLTWEEARDLARGEYPYPECLPHLIEERRASREAAASEQLPALFVGRAGERPGHDRAVIAAPPQAAEGVLHGVTVSRGRVRARARVLRDPLTGPELQHGEVLVAASADPGWTPLILLAGGLVLERGGVLSHGAIVAREAGIPGLVQVPDACRAIADGDTVVLDADAGTVCIAPPGA